jgi:hypothetical protein
MAISARAGMGKPVYCPRRHSTGRPRIPPTQASSFTPGAISRQLAMNSNGSMPGTTTTGSGSFFSNALSRWMRPCLPGEMYRPVWSLSWIITRYVPMLIQSESGSLVMTHTPVPR